MAVQRMKEHASIESLLRQVEAELIASSSGGSRGDVGDASSPPAFSNFDHIFKQLRRKSFVPNIFS